MHRRPKKSFSLFADVKKHHILVVALIAIILVGAVYFYQKTELPPSWCLPFEQLDRQGGYCYATCEDDFSCGALDEQYKIAQDAFTNEERMTYYNFSTIPIPIPDNGLGPSESSIYTIHRVNNGILGEIIAASSTTLYQEDSQPTWDLISLVLPDIALPYVTEFAGFDDPYGGTAAFVMPMDETSRTWSINVNYVGFYTWRNTLFDRGNSIHLLIHEIGHVVTLANAFDPGSYKYDWQGNYNENRPPCYTTQFAAGCAKAGSYLAIFAARFWPDAKGQGDASGVYSPLKFISAYAATNIAEDMAESWAAFFLLDKPTGSTLADKKIRFFYEYPEFVSARKEILKNIHRLH
ncbi:MAG TPA: hypothetical protein VI483_02975 [Candidatus Paceibacterota bacterium]